jgi:carnitine 3-dehydrogenase
MAFHVACGEGGMATNLDQFGPALKLPWTRLEAPELTPELRDRMVDGCNAIAAGRRFKDMAAAARPGDRRGPARRCAVAASGLIALLV